MTKRRHYHDIGGAPAGPVTREARPVRTWEMQAEAIRAVLSAKRLVSTDEIRRGFETFGADLYDSLGFYERRIESLLRILYEKGVIAESELKARVAQAKARRATGS